ncbi:methionine ABC transporter permease [Gulosibacter molinativorax]|uniref:ABC transporter permease n=1 Tax=Gulosibacter molinativorax TaxID=256821 RepID=A0ABT7C9V9_9MICO|nr:methionine ABC transporter permease [Gulosibacter molinativorax]MDJ1371880.1 ABC transporter permease [Gulosibacter molinativorax]QUY62529.1 Methionine import system permease protein MetP [Gulosibacter molinativorax]
MNILDELQRIVGEYGEEIGVALAETGYMVGVSLVVAVLFGLPLGVLIYLTREGGLTSNRILWNVANFYVTVVRSFPFLLFVVFMIPFTRMVFGTSFGTVAATFPLAFVAIAIYARFTEQILLELPSGLLQAAASMGATVPQTVMRFLLVDARSGLVYALTSAMISFVSYSAVLGVVGGGGVGDFAMRYGYHKYDFVLMYTVIALIIIAVLLLQSLGTRISRALDKR